jgi:L-iditol 2-dehydrogenase
MKALRLYGPNDLRLVEVPVPEISDGEILIKTLAAAVCGTDVRMWKNGYEGVDDKHPLTLGHEFCGKIVKVGKNVKGYKEGDIVALQPNIGCGLCDKCVRGDFHLCPDYKAFGINIDGAFSEYVRLPESSVVRGNISLVPSNLLPEEAAVAEPLSCVYNGQSRINVKPGDVALVVGGGPIGCFHAMLLKMAGAKVLLTDLSEDRLAYDKKIMPYITSYCGDNLKGFVREATCGRGLDIDIVACPSASAQVQSLELMDYGGRILFFGGIAGKNEPVALNTNLIHYKELLITGSTRSNIDQYRKVLSLLSQGMIDGKKIITDRYPLEDGLKAFENSAAAQGLKHVIVFPE